MAPITPLLPRALFVVLLALKAWQLVQFIRRRSAAAGAEVERFRAALERRWLKDGQAR